METLHFSPASTVGPPATESDAAGDADGRAVEGPSGGDDDPAAAASRRPLRIAHVTDFYLPRVGGIEMHVAGLAGQQRRAGHEVDVITVGGVVDGDDLHPTARPTSASFSPRTVRGATRALLDGGYDLVHAHAGLATPLTFTAAQAAGRAGLPTTVTVHSMIGPLASTYRALDAATHWRRWPVAWSAVSDAAAEPLRGLLGPDRVVDVLPNAIDVEAWRPLPRSSRHDGELVVVSVMRLAPRKRPLPLLRLLRDAQRAIAPAHTLRVVIVGDGPQRPAMERFLERHDMGWVQLVGLQGHEAIRRLFRAADLFVAPARKESFGIAALEARAAGLPVVAMACSGVGEFLEHGSGGLLVEDDRAMSATIANLATNPMDLAGMTVHNRLIRPPFGWAQALERTEAVYERAQRIQRRAGAIGAPQSPPPARRPQPIATPA